MTNNTYSSDDSQSSDEWIKGQAHSSNKYLYRKTAVTISTAACCPKSICRDLVARWYSDGSGKTPVGTMWVLRGIAGKFGKKLPYTNAIIRHAFYNS